MDLSLSQALPLGLSLSQALPLGLSLSQPPPLGSLPLSNLSPWAAPSPRYPFADCLEAGQDTAGLCRYIVFRYYPRGDLHRFVFDRFADTAGVQVTPCLALSSPLSIPI